MLKNIDVLLKAGLISKDQTASLTKVSETFQVGVSDHIANTIETSGSTSGLVKQFVPDSLELEIADNELKDPIGDAKHSPMKGIVHRYPDRVLFKPIAVCPVYCRFCFRKEKVGPGNKSLNPAELEACFKYIAGDTNIWEVILTGGDPLLLKPKVLSKIIFRLKEISHVSVLRIHSRVVTVAPEFITDAMVDALTGFSPMYVSLHINHPDEFTVKAIEAMDKLSRANIPLVSQTVLLAGVNDNIEVLGALMRLLVKNKIRPYYLHHCDLAKGTSHFRTSIAKGQQLIKELRGRYSGLCQPTYVLDIPGGYGKSPLTPNYLNTKSNDNNTTVEDYCGKNHEYGCE